MDKEKQADVTKAVKDMNEGRKIKPFDTPASEEKENGMSLIY